MLIPSGKLLFVVRLTALAVGDTRPRRPDHHKGNLVAAHRLLRIVEDERSVEEFEFGSLRGQPSQLQPAARGWLRLQRRIIGTALDLRPVDRGSAQKAGFFVGVIRDHFQKQADRFAPMRRELHQEPRLVVEFGAPVRRRRQLLRAGTLLRVVRRRACAPAEASTVVGVDDWAFRRNHRYGTIVCDLEQRQIVRLLPDREIATVQAWLAAHPEIKIISRDRGGGYGEAAAKALPAAMQVADRWHLMENASAAFP